MQTIAKKIIPYLLILITFVGVGLFGWAGKADAQETRNYNCLVIFVDASAKETFAQIKTLQNVCNSENKTQLAELLGIPSAKRIVKTYWVPESDPAGVCTASDGNNRTIIATGMPSVLCEFEVMTLKHPEKNLQPKPYNYYNWKSTTETLPSEDDGTTTEEGEKTAFEREINANKCGVGPLDGTITGCFIQIFYGLFYQIPSFLLWASAYFFNVLVFITLSGALFSKPFVAEAWGVVRDLSNIFFILILLYIAIKIILDLGGHDAKKMIAKVIIIALLINFSMFFTKIIIDTSNILALIFYNKIEVSTKDANGNERPYQKTAYNDKDVAGGMVSAFNPTKLVSEEYLNNAKTQTVDINGNETVVPSQRVGPGILIGMLVITGALMLFASYCLLVAGLSFMGRLIELFTLIIFSPFAFMSSTVPKLAGIENLGWDAWFKRLISASFMAPIFMFFLYFIFMLIHSNIFDGLATGTKTRLIESILAIVLPALLILILLLQATKYAKKGSGTFGETIISGAKVLAGLAVGGVALGAAAAGRATVGTTAKYVQNEGARKKDFKFTDLTTAAKQGWYKPWKYPSIVGSAVTGTAKFIPAAIATGIHKVGIGKKLKEADEGYGHKTHATHILDAKMQSEFGHQYGKDAKYKDLTEHEQEIVKKEIEKDEMAKFQYGKQFKDLEAPEAKLVQDQYNAGNRAIDDGHGNTKGIGTTPGAVQGGVQFKSDYIVAMSKTNAAVGEFVQALRKGSYDVRNLPDMSAKSKGFSKFGVALISGVAAGVRLGLKKGGGVEYGTPQKDIFKDIGNTITEALKNVKINISGGGGGGGHDDGHVKEVKSVGH